jgi:tRNA-specific 2-thiouridylase
MFMINWHDTTGTLAGDCPWNDDLIFAELVARNLGIPLKTVDFSEEYRKRVVDYMFSEYERGRTPNPDVLCNREVKFDLFIKAARDAGADYIATGHYCRKEELVSEGKTIYRLLQGIDPNKDQSYFLCQLSQEQLRMAVFPIGNLMKHEVRDIAREQGLATAERKDSQGICFVGKVDLPEFLRQKLKSKPGSIIEVPDDLPVYAEYGQHHREWLKGHENPELLSPAFQYVPSDGWFRITQRRSLLYDRSAKGLNIGGKPEPMLPIATDTMAITCMWNGTWASRTEPVGTFHTVCRYTLDTA